MGVAPVYSVRDCTIIKQRGKNFVHCAFDVVEAFDIQEGLLLSREGGVGEIFRGG
ncbi:hypothetical protein HSBAA_36240 [Vreelandella sulfidaeris]|uniref:Uncharacterized protein n=1 Tax=Vreelandella sulfidaeris TaxID=115553 RepID=A0A455UDC0_9GAMM|nr:hypothetical protein HSBAA_36240 [Halomonas sulfidaeris]